MAAPRPWFEQRSSHPVIILKFLASSLVSTPLGATSSKDIPSAFKNSSHCLQSILIAPAPWTLANEEAI